MNCRTNGYFLVDASDINDLAHANTQNHARSRHQGLTGPCTDSQIAAFYRPLASVVQKKAFAQALTTAGLRRDFYCSVTLSTGEDRRMRRKESRARIVLALAVVATSALTTVERIYGATITAVYHGNNFTTNLIGDSDGLLGIVNFFNFPNVPSQDVTGTFSLSPCFNVASPCFALLSDSVYLASTSQPGGSIDPLSYVTFYQGQITGWAIVGNAYDSSTGTPNVAHLESISDANNPFG